MAVPNFTDLVGHRSGRLMAARRFLRAILGLPKAATRPPVDDSTIPF